MTDLEDQEHHARPTATIQAVDKDAFICALLDELLTESGHHVVLAANGAEALAHAGAEGVVPQLLLTGVDLPDMKGSELASRLIAQQPQLKVIFMTDLAPDALLRLGVYRHDTILRKPFGYDQLEACVEATLRTSS